jgi:hypothetical protein
MKCNCIFHEAAVCYGNSGLVNFGFIDLLCLGPEILSMIIKYPPIA